jgi:putative transposase
MGKGGPKQVKRQRHSPEQIIRKLRTAEQMLSEGRRQEKRRRRWRSPSRPCTAGATQYGGMKAADAKRLKELEEENRELKQIVADQTLDIRAYKEIAKGNF